MTVTTDHTLTTDQPTTATAPAGTASTGLPEVVPPRSRDTRWELAAALRQLGRLGYEFGFNGHVSARATEAPGHYWVNPFGVSISTVTPADLVLVDDRGEVVDPRGGQTINGFAGNLALHQQIPEAAVAIHLHTPRGFIWSNLGRPLRAVTTDAALVVGLQGLSARIWGEESGPTNVELARAGKRVILQRGHGFVTWGGSVGEAAFYLWAAERAADANLALLGVAEPEVLSAELVTKWTLTPELARAHFEPAFTLAEAEGLR
ncbi:class II aldolase/adducin family protein [Raineyella sp. W15-4]|uniref:class II aldolase/adducin family protein n=1 Tax=Raineyella sp. W15-4 TaxID=3081651 RepID=UPI0029549245|nr:class II aldolase/adducin family protein [Raineyella sp. W15-4]WOQ16119.1 class II aldolase/adducin family protein [Raineyella sp. W15-4]